MPNLDIINCNYNDLNVWDMIGDGRVKGCFQIESFLGKDWCKKLKPRNINELADLISLIRPGCLSMAQIYCDRRSKKSEVASLHPLIDDVLKDTFGIIVYQEQSMMIAQKLAGFTLEQADDLRKAIGKKKADLMKKVRTQFIEGCIANNVPELKAVEIFDIIELSNRYSFNKSACPETTYVEKKDGTSCKMKDIEIGDEIKTPHGFSAVKDKMDHGVLDLFEIELDNGKTIRCTINHKFLCTTGEILPLWQIISLKKEIVSE